MTAQQHVLDLLAHFRTTSSGKTGAVPFESVDATVIYQASYDLACLWRSHLWDELINEQDEYTEQCRMDWEELGEALHRIMRVAGRERPSRV